MLIVWPKIPQMPQNLSAQFVCPSPKVLYFNEKRLHWATVVRAHGDMQILSKHKFDDEAAHVSRWQASQWGQRIYEVAFQEIFFFDFKDFRLE